MLSARKLKSNRRYNSNYPLRIHPVKIEIDGGVCKAERHRNQITAAAYFEAQERAINGGWAWKFQRSFGRTMMAAIEVGRCLHGPRPAQNAWGTRILRRSKVDQGTKGSREFVATRQGVGWAARMEGV